MPEDKRRKHRFEGHDHTPECIVYVPNTDRFHDAISEYENAKHVTVIILDPEMCDRYLKTEPASKAALKTAKRKAKYKAGGEGGKNYGPSY